MSLPSQANASTVQPSRAKRVATSLPITINGETGSIQNLSTTGIYFEMDKNHEPGSQIQFTIDMHTAGGPLQIQCRGQIVRSQMIKDKFGIAVKILESDLRAA